MGKRVGERCLTGEKHLHPTKPAMLFLDSGAHSLYNEELLGNKAKRAGVKEVAKVNLSNYGFFEKREFWKYVDSYADFLISHKDVVDYYVSVDVIYNPELSMDVWEYLRKAKGLDPVPVVHLNTPREWTIRYLEGGCKILGVGGLGQGATVDNYLDWADDLFDLLCDNPDRLPCVRTHGFAMTSYSLLLRYPWWSVDSASWAKCAAFGSVYVPHKRRGEFTFGKPPYVVGFSYRSPKAKEAGSRHFGTLDFNDQEIVKEWLRKIDIPLGKVDREGKTTEEGVINHYGSRGIANLRFFEAMCAWLPEWPWPFPKRVRKGVFT